jgi:hypothetical protein
LNTSWTVALPSPTVSITLYGQLLTAVELIVPTINPVLTFTLTPVGIFEVLKDECPKHRSRRQDQGSTANHQTIEAVTRRMQESVLTRALEAEALDLVRRLAQAEHERTAALAAFSALLPPSRTLGAVPPASI